MGVILSIVKSQIVLLCLNNIFIFVRRHTTVYHLFVLYHQSYTKLALY